jgi:hypothetical protein
MSAPKTEFKPLLDDGPLESDFKAASLPRFNPHYISDLDHGNRNHQYLEGHVLDPDPREKGYVERAVEVPFSLLLSIFDPNAYEKLSTIQQMDIAAHLKRGNNRKKFINAVWSQLEKKGLGKSVDEMKDDLTRDGDVEKNPGPPKSAKKLIKRVLKEEKKIMKRVPLPRRRLNARVAIPKAVVKQEKKIARAEQKNSSYIMRPIVTPSERYRMTPIRSLGRNASMQAQNFKGTSIVSTNIVAEDSKTGSFVYTVQLSPTSLGVRQANAWAGYFQRFWIRKIRFRLITGMPQNEQGGIAGFFNSEPTDDIRATALADRLSSAAKRPGFKVFNVWKEKIEWVMPPPMANPMTRDGKVMNELFYIDKIPGSLEPRLISMGSFNIIVSNVLGSLSAASLGNLEIDYDFDLYFQQDDNISPNPLPAPLLHCTGSGTEAALNIWGDAPVILYNSSSLIPFVRNTGGGDLSDINGFPTTYPSVWMVNFKFAGTDFSDADIAFSAGTDCTLAVTDKMKTISSTEMSGFLQLTVSPTGLNPRIHVSLTGASIVPTSTSYYMIGIPQTFLPKVRSQAQRITDLESRLQEFLSKDFNGSVRVQGENSEVGSPYFEIKVNSL